MHTLLNFAGRAALQGVWPEVPAHVPCNELALAALQVLKAY